MKHPKLSLSIHRCLATCFTLIALTSSAATNKPRIVVSIFIDQLTFSGIESYASYFGTDGFKKLMEQGNVYTNATFPHTPVDRSNAIATLMTGTTPYYHGIIGNRWLNRTTVQQMGCTDDPEQNGVYTIEKASARHILTSTITDELKVKTDGKAIVYGIAEKRDAAILLAGHAADGAFWKDTYTNTWCSSTYYMKSGPDWLVAFNTSPERKKKKKTEFEQLTELTNLAKLCIERTGMGSDDVPDMLCISLDASTQPDPKKKLSWQEMQAKTYMNVDRQLADLVATIEHQVGAQNVVFYISGLGYSDEPTKDYAHYRIPTGTVYINRVANLLNLYLGALYGSDRYVDGCSHNQIYLNAKDIEQKRLKLNEILSLSQSFLLQCEGIRNAYTLESLQTSRSRDTEAILGNMNVTVGGHIALDIAPGWQLENEDTQEAYSVDARKVKFPLFIYRPSHDGKHITIPVTAEQLAATLAETLQIQTPNGCSAEPLPSLDN